MSSGYQSYRAECVAEQSAAVEPDTAVYARDSRCLEVNRPANTDAGEIIQIVYDRITNCVDGSLNFKQDEIVIRDEIEFALLVLTEGMRDGGQINADDLTNETAAGLRELAAKDIRKIEAALKDNNITVTDANRELIRNLGLISMAYSVDGLEEEIDEEFLSTLDDEALTTLASEKKKSKKPITATAILEMRDANSSNVPMEVVDYSYLEELSFEAQLKLVLRAERRLNLAKAIALREMILDRDDVTPRDLVESFTFLIKDLNSLGKVTEAFETAEDFWDYLVALLEENSVVSKDLSLASRQVRLYEQLCSFEDILATDDDSSVKADNWREEREETLLEFLEEDETELSDGDRLTLYEMLFNNIEDTANEGFQEAVEYCSEALDLTILSHNNALKWARRKNKLLIKDAASKNGEGYSSNDVVLYAEFAFNYRLFEEEEALLMIAKGRTDLYQKLEDEEEEENRAIMVQRSSERLIEIFEEKGEFVEAAELADRLLEMQTHNLAAGDSASTMTWRNRINSRVVAKRVRLNAKLLHFFKFIDSVVLFGEEGYKIRSIDEEGQIQLQNPRQCRQLSAELRKYLNGESALLHEDVD